MHIDPGLKEELKQYLLQKMHDTKKKVTVVSAYRLEKHEMDTIIHQFDYLEHAKIDNEVDSSILAGFVIKFGTKRIDVSLKRRIDDVNASLTKTLE